MKDKLNKELYIPLVKPDLSAVCAQNIYFLKIDFWKIYEPITLYILWDL